MSTLTLRPNGAGSSTQWTPSTGANWQCVDEATVDDADFVSVGDTNKLDTYALTNHTTEDGLINSVTIFYRFKSDVSSNYITPRLVLGAYTTSGTHIHPTTSFVTGSEALSRPGGGSWTFDDIDSLQAGIYSYAAGGDVVYCSWIYVVIDYTEYSGNQIFWMI